MILKDYTTFHSDVKYNNIFAMYASWHGLSPVCCNQYNYSENEPLSAKRNIRLNFSTTFYSCRTVRQICVPCDKNLKLILTLECIEMVCLLPLFVVSDATIPRSRLVNYISAFHGNHYADGCKTESILQMYFSFR